MTLEPEKSQNPLSASWRPNGVVQGECGAPKTREICGIGPSLQAEGNQCLSSEIRRGKVSFPLPFFFYLVV